MPNFCLCGCKNELPIGRKYVHGHNFNSEFAKYARSKSTGHLGHKHTGDLSRFGKHRIGISPTNAWKKGFHLSPSTEFHKGHTPFNKGKPHLVKENNPNWQGGKSYEHYPEEWKETFKKSIRQRDNYKCQECGIQQSKLKGFHKKLIVHHIDYDKRNLELKNLITLCRKCHIKTNINRSYWIDYFRHKF